MHFALSMAEKGAKWKWKVSKLHIECAWDLMISIPFSKFFLESDVCNGPSKVPFSRGFPIFTCLYTSTNWSSTFWYILSWSSCKTRIQTSRIRCFHFDQQSNKFMGNIKMNTTSLRHVVHRWPAVPTAANRTERTASWISASSMTTIALFPLNSSKHFPYLSFTVCWTIRPTYNLTYAV